METRLGWTCFGLVFLGMISVGAFAQQGGTTSKDEVRTISGCLTKSATGGGYVLTGNDGSAYEIQPNSSVDLAGNLGQRVEAKGVVSQQKMQNTQDDSKQGSDDATKNSAREHAHLQVSELHKTGDSCEL